jgi:putative DNA primase/helicase
VHQILSLRPIWSEKKQKWDVSDNTHFKNGWGFDSIADIFSEQINDILEKIPETERYNLFFTVAKCSQKKREFFAQDVICFDLDGIDKATDPKKYIDVFCKTVGVSLDEIAVVNSGNGLHFYIQLKIPFTSREFFDTYREHYKALCATVTQAIHAENLYLREKEGTKPAGGLDPAVFEPRRIMRLPHTINRKEGKEDSRCVVLYSNIKPISFDLTACTGIPVIKKGDALTDKDTRKVSPFVDNKAIFDGCAFMRFVKEGGAYSEPQWYAALSIAGRMKDASAVVHTLSEAHPRYKNPRVKYNSDETERKLTHALNASGPRTCKSISGIFEGCATCPNAGCGSPINLRSEEKIKTQDTGFHEMYFDEESGAYKRGKPCYTDLLKFFERENPFVTHSETCWVFNGKFYDIIGKREIQAFAQKHFDPAPSRAMVYEFQELVFRSNIVKVADWDESTFRKINFANGVLDTATGEFLPHSKEYAFKYILPYDYDPEARTEVFDKFLSDIMCDDPELVQILKEFMGYSISGDDCKGAKALFLEGDGNNGKSTFIKVLKALAGENNYTTLPLKDLSSMERCHALDGSLFNIAEETPDRVADSNAFKNLVDGGELEVRRLYADNYRIKNRAKLIFTCNKLPASYDNSKGYRRRLLIVPFLADFSKPPHVEDKDMDLKLLRELSGIFNVVYAAYRQFVARGKKFSESAKAEKVLAEYMFDNDIIAQWLEDCVTVTDNEADEVSINKLHRSFVLYCEERAIRNIEAPAWFGRHVRKLLAPKGCEYVKKKTTRGYTKIKLAPFSSDSDY